MDGQCSSNGSREGHGRYLDALAVGERENGKAVEEKERGIQRGESQGRMKQMRE